MPRPLTHDLITNISQAFGIKLTEIFIYKFEDGIFYSELTFNDGDRQIVIDARTSDAVALAIRTKAPIFTTREIIDETGFIMEVTGENSYSLEKDTKQDNEIKLENLAIEELERMLNKHIDLEEYEQAAHISKIIKQKKEAI